MDLFLLALLGTVQPLAASAPPPPVRALTPPAMIVPGPPPQTGPGGARARANLASYVTADDYPREAIRAGEEGTTGFRLTIGPDGRVTACTVEKSSGSALLDAATCRIMQSRARFTPAVDPAGRPTSDSVSARIAWRLPQGRIIPDLVVISFHISSEGKASDCSREVVMNGRVDRRTSPDCGPSPPDGPYFDALRREAKGAAARVTIEARLIRDADAPWPDLERTGRRVVARELARVQVAGGGQVIGCSVLEYQPLAAPTMRACSALGSRIGQYEKAGASEMRLVLFTSLSAEPRR